MLVKLDAATYRKIKALVSKGTYSSVENFVEIAMKNQLLLETTSRLETIRLATPHTTDKREQPKLSSLLIIPKKAFMETLVTKPIDEQTRNSPIWGQINRLAPIKFVMRILVNDLITREEATVDLKRFSADVAQLATQFRRFAKKKDRKRRIRGEELYVGFPKKSPSSQQRFLNYYVGKGRLRKWTDSILVGLSLVSVEELEDGSAVMGPTEVGLRFALMHSPIIDDFFLATKQIESPFSEHEVSFLIEHLSSVRPGEMEFLRFILKAIKKGTDTPTELRSEVYSFLSHKDLDMKISEKVANTMQIGAIGRLVEMRLIKIEKDGQRSKYIQTNNGENLTGLF